MNGDTQQFSDAYLQIWSDGKYDLIDEFYSSDYQSRTGSTFGNDRGGARRQAEAFRSAFPDIHWEVAEQHMDGDLFVLRYDGDGTNTGGFMGMPPTHKHVSMSGASFMRMKDGKVVESWEYFDTGGMLMQLGMMPMDTDDGEGG
jgi:steroid delta-isomerase-like uncharacterized protein